VITITAAEARLWPVKVYALPVFEEIATIKRPAGMSHDHWEAYKIAEVSRLRCERNATAPGKPIVRGRCTADEMVILIRR
jgi:hypothetical protein